MIPRLLRRLTSTWLACFFFFPCFSVSSAGQTPQFSSEGFTVVSGNARFQFLTPTLVRLEYSSSGSFVNQPTAVVERRWWDGVAPATTEKKGWLVASTPLLTVRYRVGSGPFSRENLTVSWKTGKVSQAWAPGDSDKSNLGGIAYSLDGAAKGKLPKFRQGILSRSGYFVLDDSRTPIWDSASAWIVPRQDTSMQDWYLFVYGRDYRHALKEFADLCGKIPMVPRYTLGTWMTDLNYEYLPGSAYVQKYPYSDEEIKKEILRFRSEGIPLDVLVLDFAWHKYGWKGGYDWSPIFPHPKEFLSWVHNEGIKVTVNDHPGYGGESVLSDEDSRSGEVRRRLNLSKEPPPSYVVDLAKDWRFSLDPDTSGVRKGWFAASFADSSWKLLQGGVPWEEQGYPEYDGYAWYRKSVLVPVDTSPRPLYLVFGGVDDEYDLYVNGTLAAHHGSPGNSVYSTLTATDVSSFVRRGQQNVITLRVNDWGGDGGITMDPVILTDRPPSGGIRFNLADKNQARVYMDVLHGPVMDDGVDFWWIDGGRGSCRMDGLNAQMWTNRVFYEYTQTHTGKRSFVFSRYGGWGSHRYPAFFTGDTYSQWPVLDYEVSFTAVAGNTAVPYVTHDLGGFLGKQISFDLYARWIEFGVFSPLVRLHCAFENPQDGNLRLPWIYGQQGIDLVKKYFRLRYRLLPYIYTAAREAHDEALPIVRPLYLEYPGLDKAYEVPGEYLFGDNLLVAPVTDSAADKKDVYLPPGEWRNYFTGKVTPGNRVIREACATDEIPLYVKSGSIIPLEPDVEYSDQRPLDTLDLAIYGPKPAEFTLYEDDGVSLDYLEGKFSRTPMTFNPLRGGRSEITIGPAAGQYKGQVENRAYRIEVYGLRQPSSVSLNGRPLQKGTDGWSWDSERSVLTIKTDAASVREQVKLSLK